MNILKSLLLFMPMVISACEMKEEFEPTQESSDITKIMNVVSQEWYDDESKSLYTDGVGISVTGLETIGVYYNAYTPSAESQFGQGLVKTVVEAKPVSEGKYSFTHSAVSGAESYNYYFLLPYRSSHSAGTQSSITKPFNHLFAVQYPSADSFDPAFDYLIGKPVYDSKVSSEITVDRFKRISAAFRFTIEDPDNLLEGEDIHSVTIDFGGNNRLAGKFYTDHGDTPEESKIISVSPSTCGSALTAVYPSGLKCEGGKYDIWYMSFPVTIAAGSNLTVTVTTQTKTVVNGTATLVSSRLVAEKLNKMTFRLSASKDVFREYKSIHQDFCQVPTSMGSKFTGSDGNERTWTNNCSGYGSSKVLVPSGVKITPSSTFTIPAVSGGKLKCIRVFAHEGTKSTSAAVATLTASCGDASVSAAYGVNDTKLGYVDLTFGQAQTGDVALTCSYSDGSSSAAVFSSLLLLYEEEKLDEMDIYLCIGQSNMAGRGILQEGDDAVIPGVYLLDGNDEPIPAQAPLNLYSTVRKGASVQGINPAWSFSKAVSEVTGRKILLVVNARGNTSIGSWKKNTDKVLVYSQKESDDMDKWGQEIPGLYTEAVRRTKEAQKYGTLKGILWHQGEANHSTSQDSYKSVLAGIANNLRNDLGVSADDVPFVVGQIGQTTYEDGDQINSTLASVGDYIENAWCASSVGCEMNSDNLHFSRNGQILLGSRYADIILKSVYGYESTASVSQNEIYQYSSQVDRSDRYAVSIGNEDVAVIPTKDPHVALFGTSQKTLVNVRFLKDVPSSVVVRPESKAYVWSYENGELNIEMNQYDQISVEPDGKTDSPLFIFANPLERTALAQAKSRADMLVLEGGKIHEYPSDLSLGAYSGVYIQGGAVVNGSLVHRTETNGVRIDGCGIIDARCNASKVVNAFNLIKASSAEISNLTILNNTNWTFRMVECADFVVDNIKAIGEKPDNDENDENDAIHLVGCRNGVVKRSFGYSWDDAFNIGTDSPTSYADTDNVTITECIGWNTQPGNTFTIGWPVTGTASNITFSNCYAIHSGTKKSPNDRGAIGVHNAGSGTITDVTFRNIQIEDPQEFGISVYLGTHGSLDEFVGGSIRNLTFEGIYMHVKPPYGSRIKGWSSNNCVDGVCLKDIYVAGQKITGIDDRNWGQFFYPSNYFKDVTFE